MDTHRKLPVTVYTPDSQLRSPFKLLRSMLADLKASRELAWRLFVRDVSAQYRQSLFGILWAFVPPIVTSAVFILLQSRNVVSFGSKNIPYPLFVLVGTILWQLFTDSLNAPLKSVTAAKPLLVRVNFPREALIVSAFYMVVFGLMIKLIVLAVVFFIFNVPLSWGLLLAPFAMLMLILLGLCVGLLITPLGMLYTDIATSLPIVIQLFFFVTPVVYETPSTFPFSLIGIFNPVSPLLVSARDLITLGSASTLIPFLVVSGLTIVFLLIAWVVYRVALPIIIERMSA